MASELALRYRTDDPECIYFIETNTVEALRSVQDRLQIGVPILFDEFEPSDAMQNIYMSPAMLKLVVQPCRASTVRGRTNDIGLHPGWRGFSANADSIDAWVGDFGKKRNDALAIRRRIYWATVLESVALTLTYAAAPPPLIFAVGAEL